MAGFSQKAWEFVGREFMGDNVGFESFADADLEHFMRIRRSWQTWKKTAASETNLEEFAIFVEERSALKRSLTRLRF